MKSISDLPGDLIEEILSRVPITSLRTVRSTCKRWNILSKDQIFTKKHCGKAAKEFLLNMSYDDEGFSPMRFDLKNTKELPSSLKKIGTVLTPVKLCNIYQCDGLFLLATTDNLGLVVWNPYLGHVRWINPRNSYTVYDQYAIGYDNKKNHKVLRRFFKEFEIFDFNSNSWRVLDITCNRLSRRTASLKGNTYYVSLAQDEKPFVICFDFTTERFGPCLKLPFDVVGEDVTLSCVREEQLAVFLYRLFLPRCSVATSEMEIWITNKIEPNAVSWSKFFKVDVQIRPSSSFLYQFVVNSFFIDEEKKVAVVNGGNCVGFGFDSIIVGEDGYLERRVLGDVFSYVPSSVQIQRQKKRTILLR